jgi:circadian clock protein KaiB
MVQNPLPDPAGAKPTELQASLRDGYNLRLYVAGNTSKSAHAILNLKKLCDEHLSGRYQLEVIDVYQQPGRARQEQIIATPTLVKFRPAPGRKLTGDFARGERILAGLGLVEAGM